MSNQNISRDHHYVPVFLLKKWSANGLLTAYIRDVHSGKVKCFKKGPNGFANVRDLLTLEKSSLPVDALEDKFFRMVDDKGAKVLTAIMSSGVRQIDIQSRCDFARFLLSIRARYPSTVEHLRTEGHSYLRESLEADEEIVAAFEAAGYTESPADWVESNMGRSLSNDALLVIQTLVDNKQIGEPLINLQWAIIELEVWNGHFLLGDRPLCYEGGDGVESSVWALPVSLFHLFLAGPPSKVAQMENMSRTELRKLVNKDSVGQSEKFVFAVDGSNLRLIEKWLGRCA